MTRGIRGWCDWGLLLALLLAFAAAGPFLTRPGLPHQTDVELHVYRAAELGHTIRGGVFYPRWAPDLYLGYGYPIFNYYAPLTYYLANLFDLCPGVNVVGGVKAVFVTGFLIAALGAYLLGREFSSSAGGVLAAASFTFAPYVVLIDPHTRGVLAEHFAICLLPLLFYAYRRLMSGAGGRGALFGSVLALSCLMLSHNLIGIVSSGLLLVYWIWEVALGPGRSRAGWGILALALAASITAFFWLPFLLEREAIKLQVIGPGHFDFHKHFVALSELLSPSLILDLGAVAPHYQFNLGLPQWLLALPALGVFFHPRWVDKKALLRRRSVCYFALAGFGLVFLMTATSTLIWERIPGMPYLQFPWRLLGPANLMLAICAAFGTELLAFSPVWRWRNPVLALGLAAILLLALPVLYPPTWSPDFGGTSPADIIEWERSSLALGTTSTGDFLPVKAARVPMHPARSLIESYAGSGPVDRVNRAVLPDGARVEVIEQGPLHNRLDISTPKSFVLRLYTFYFPGWRATIDGEEVDIEVAGPEGFITVWVPKGEHKVIVRFGDTGPRTAGWVISAAGLGVWVVAVLLFPRSSTSCLCSCFRGSDARTFIWLSSVFLLFLVLKSGVIDPRDDWLRYTSPPGQARAAVHEMRADFGGQIELIGYDLEQKSVRSGDKFPVVLYWHALAPLEENYQSFVHLARPLHVLWGQEDHLNPGGLPTTRWPLDKYVWDEYEIHVLPGTPPGEYLINVGMPSWAGGYRLIAYDEGGQVMGDSVVIGSVEVRHPRRQPAVSALGLTHEVMTAVPEGDVILLGYVQRDAQVTASDVWPVTVFWRAERKHPAARTRALVLLDADGKEVVRVSGEPLDGYYPFELWREGEIVRDPLQLAMEQYEEYLDPGPYRFGVAVSIEAQAGVNERFVPLGTVESLGEEKVEDDDEHDDQK